MFILDDDIRPIDNKTIIMSLYRNYPIFSIINTRDKFIDLEIIHIKQFRINDEENTVEFIDNDWHIFRCQYCTAHGLIAEEIRPLNPGYGWIVLP